ncbi:signal peptidase II [Pseudaestuariivita sp.]|uniref:signal peptidase II n=1 Tax=Pseudaestuariivita sp. TaxID=2211669 RepID=UPI0040581ED6
MALVFWVSFWTFLLDQVTKYVVVHMLDLKTVGSLDVIDPFLNLRMAWNYGINFGLFASNQDVMRWALIALALGIVAVVIVWMLRDPPGKLGLISAGLLIGGALGNIVDRVLYGAVADFLNMSCCGIENPYAFNVADITIFIGAFGLVFFGGSESGKSAGDAPRKSR